MVWLAVIIKRRMWNIRGTAERKAVGLKCIKIRCAVLNVCHDSEPDILCSAACPAGLTGIRVLNSPLA